VKGYKETLGMNVYTHKEQGNGAFGFWILLGRGFFYDKRGKITKWTSNKIPFGPSFGYCSLRGGFWLEFLSRLLALGKHKYRCIDCYKRLSDAEIDAKEYYA
jgi:hypothetical protein